MIVKSYRMRMVKGKTTNYDANGKLKNEVIEPVFTGEREIMDLIKDKNYKSLGVCEIKCISCCESGNAKKQFPEDIERINKILKGDVKIAPKSRVEKLEDEVNELKELLKAKIQKPVDKSDERIQLETKAKGLNIKFRADISDEKLEEKISEIENK